MATPTVRRGLNFLPGIAWALLIDGADLAANAVEALLIPVAGIGLTTGVAADVLQTCAAWYVFNNNSTFLLGAGEIVLPAGLDLFPTTTAIYLAKSMGL